MRKKRGEQYITQKSKFPLISNHYKTKEQQKKIKNHSQNNAYITMQTSKLKDDYNQKINHNAHCIIKFLFFVQII